MQPSKRSITYTLAIAAAAGLAATAHAASDSWIVATAGDYSLGTNWVAGNVPNGAADVATVEGTGSSVTLSASIGLLRLDLAQSSTGGAPVFTQNDGTVTAGSLRFGGAGGSRNPTYHLNAGQLDMATFTWGNGSSARFNVSGGTANYSGSALTIGVASGANGTVSVSSGTFNHTGTGQIQLGTTSNGRGNIAMSGGTFNSSSAGLRIGAQSGGTGSISLEGSSVFNLTASSGDIYLGNNSGTGNLSIGGTAQFNAQNHLLVVGQFGSTGRGTVTMTGGTLKASRIVIGNNNTASAMAGWIDHSGGTIETGQIRKGNSSTAASATANYYRANGGTIKAIAYEAGNSSFFDAAFVTLSAGGLNFDTNGNEIGINNAMTGDGGLHKLGSGTLSLTGGNVYTGGTTVSAGVLRLGASDVLADAGALVLSNATVNADGASDTIGSFALAGGGASTLQFGSEDLDPELPAAHAMTFSALGTLNGTLTVTNWSAGVDRFLFVNQADAEAVAALTTFVNASGNPGTEGAMVVDSDGLFAVVAPEPGSLGLLALAVPLLGRRRRNA